MLDAQRRSQTRVKLHPQLSTLAPKAVGLDEQEAKAAARLKLPGITSRRVF